MQSLPELLTALYDYHVQLGEQFRRDVEAAAKQVAIGSGHPIKLIPTSDRICRDRNGKPLIRYGKPVYLLSWDADERFRIAYGEAERIIRGRRQKAGKPHEHSRAWQYAVRWVSRKLPVATGESLEEYCNLLSRENRALAVGDKGVRHFEEGMASEIWTRWHEPDSDRRLLTHGIDGLSSGGAGEELLREVWKRYEDEANEARLLPPANQESILGGSLSDTNRKVAARRAYQLILTFLAQARGINSVLEVVDSSILKNHDLRWIMADSELDELGECLAELGLRPLGGRVRKHGMDVRQFWMEARNIAPRTLALPGQDPFLVVRATGVEFLLALEDAKRFVEAELKEAAASAEGRLLSENLPVTADARVTSAVPLIGEDALLTINRMLGNDPEWTKAQARRWMKTVGITIYSRKTWTAAFGKLDGIRGNPSVVDSAALTAAIHKELEAQERASELIDTVEARKTAIRAQKHAEYSPNTQSKSRF